MTIAKAIDYLADAKQRYGWSDEAKFRDDMRVKVAYEDVITLVEAWLRGRKKKARR